MALLLVDVMNIVAAFWRHQGFYSGALCTFVV